MADKERSEIYRAILNGRFLVPRNRSEFIAPT
jgi:hypothetical protein